MSSTLVWTNLNRHRGRPKMRHPSNAALVSSVYKDTAECKHLIPHELGNFTGLIPGSLLRLLNYDLRRLRKSLFQTKGYLDDIFHASSLLMVPCWLLASRRASPACWR